MIRTSVNTTQFRANFAAYARDVKEMSDQASERSARAMRNQMKRIAPRKTGKLISTIEAVKVQDGWEVHSGGAVTTKRVGGRSFAFDYALIQEFGTKSGRRADPYHRPARSKARKSHRARIRAGIKRIARKYSP